MNVVRNEQRKLSDRVNTLKDCSGYKDLTLEVIAIQIFHSNIIGSRRRYGTGIFRSQQT